MLLPLLFLVSGVLAELPEVSRTTPQIVEYYGYPSETHHVVTKDGYILELHRIPCGVKSPCLPGVKRRVIFLQHGLLACSVDWVLNTPEKSPGFFFADEGFDVWMGNIRGNRYSTNHTTLKPDSKKFWQYSFDEHAKFDLPAMLYYALEKAGVEYLYYVGHSQGTLIGFILFSEDHELASRVRGFFALAPVVSTKRMKGLFRILADALNVAEDIAGPIEEIGIGLGGAPVQIALWLEQLISGRKRRIDFKVYQNTFYMLLGSGQFAASDETAQSFVKLICRLTTFTEEMCMNMFNIVSGPDTWQRDRSRLEAFLAHYPAGTSSRNILHWLQFVRRSSTPAKFDYRNPDENFAAYGQETPPEYDLTNLPGMYVNVLPSDDDWLAQPQDVVDVFANVRGIAFITTKACSFNHLDFLFGSRAPTLFREILDGIKGVENYQKTYDHRCFLESKPEDVNCAKILPPPYLRPNVFTQKECILISPRRGGG